MILEILGKSDRAMTATEINNHLGLPKQTVHRLCATLEAKGFLTRPGNGKRFQPARRLRELGSGLLYNSRDHIARRHILEDVSSQVGETVNFVVPEDGGMHYADRVETDWAFRIQLPIGTNVPFHCTASGKCFLASLPRKKREVFVSTLNLKKLTANTHVTIDGLLRELADIAKRGYALDQEEFIDGMVAIAVPVKDPANRFVGAIAFHGPIQRISIEDAVDRRSILTAAAEQMTKVLFPPDDE